jgi:hypothetical protein
MIILSCASLSLNNVCNAFYECRTEAMLRHSVAVELNTTINKILQYNTSPKFFQLQCSLGDIGQKIGDMGQKILQQSYVESIFEFKNMVNTGHNRLGLIHVVVTAMIKLAVVYVSVKVNLPKK